MKGKVIGASESSVAVRTLERFNAGVLAVMTREFIGSSKLPVAALPCALVWLFTGVGSLVSLEVGTLGVDLVAARVLTSVDALVPLWRFGVVVDGVHELEGVVRGN